MTWTLLFFIGISFGSGLVVGFIMKGVIDISIAMGEVYTSSKELDVIIDKMKSDLEKARQEETRKVVLIKIERPPRELLN